MAMRISGLASGMDIDSMVTAMMKPEQAKIDRVGQQKTKGQWLQDAYHDIGATLARFILDRKTDFDLSLNAVNGTILSSSVEDLTWLKKASLDGSDIAGITVDASAIDGNYKINVKALAQNWSAASREALPQVSGDTPDTLKNRFSLNGDARIDVTIATNKGKLRITSDPSATAEDGVKLVRLDITKNSLSDVAGMINSANIGARANFDVTSGRFFLQTAATGASSTLKINDSSSGLGEGRDGFMAGSNNALKLSVENSNGLSAVAKDTEYKGSDAVLDFGAAKNITQGSNEFKINGINFSLKKTGEANVQVSTDVNAAFDKIKKFVDEYNKLVDGINAKLSEESYRDYPPLTDEQRKSMSEDDIKKWEEKAQSGLLRNNLEVAKAFRDIRSSISSKVEGVNEACNSLAKIGITTEMYSADYSGKLVINEEQLKDALQEDAAGVVNLLFKSPDAKVTDKAEQKKQSGVVGKVFIDIIDGIKSIVNKAGTGNNAGLFRSVQSNMLIDFVTTYGGKSALEKDIANYQTRLAELNDRYTEVQTRYYNQFTAMEQAISRANTQSAWLSQQLGTSAGQ